MDGAVCAETPRLIRESITERLAREKKGLEERLSDINIALDALNKNPEVGEVINLLSKITHF